MYARVTTVSIQADKVAEATRIYADSIMPAVKGASGNRGAYLLLDNASGKGVSITFWESKAAGDAYDADGTYRQLVGLLAATFAGAPTLEGYEVVVQG